MLNQLRLRYLRFKTGHEPNWFVRASPGLKLGRESFKPCFTRDAGCDFMPFALGAARRAMKERAPAEQVAGHPPARLAIMSGHRAWQLTHVTTKQRSMINEDALPAGACALRVIARGSDGEGQKADRDARARVQHSP
jgi:hypothetical protein